MLYNLTNTQKEVLRTLVHLPTTTLAVVWSFQGPEILGVNSGEAKLPDSVTISMLRSLDRLGLISMSEGPQPHFCEIEILQDAINLVLSDFQEPAVSPPIPSNKEESALLTAMNDLFSDEDIQRLCFEMGIDYENIPGKTKQARIMGLIGEVKRNGRLLNFVARVIYVRSNHNWIDALS